MDENIELEKKKKKKKKKKTGEEIQNNLIAYTSKKQGAIGDVARIVKKRNKALENVMSGID